MKPVTKILISETFQQLEIEEAGYFKTIDASLWGLNARQKGEIEMSANNLASNMVLGNYMLAHSISYERLSGESNFNFNKPLESLSQRDGSEKWLHYPETKDGEYPFIAASEPGVIKDDQGFVIDIKRFSLGETTTKSGYLFILLKGITPNVTGKIDEDGDEISCDTLILCLPLFDNEPIVYGFIDYDSFDETLDNIVDKTDIGASPSDISAWLNYDGTVTIKFQRIDNYLFIDCPFWGTNKPLAISTSEKFQIKDPIVKVCFTGACSPILRFGDIQYKEEGTLTIKARVGYPTTETPQFYTEYFNVASDEQSNITIDESVIVGDYVVGRLFFKTNDPFYSPSIYRLNISIPAKYKRNNVYDPVDISQHCISWSAEQSMDGVPTASVIVNNGLLEYSYNDFEALIGKQIRIIAGFAEVGTRPRFTGIIKGIALTRGDPVTTTVTLEAEGMSRRLSGQAMYRREYDGEYHQLAVVDVCSSAQIANVITEAPVSGFEKLYYGKDEAMNFIEVGGGYLDFITSILEFSGWVISEDEYGNIIYAHRNWRNVGFRSPITFGTANPTDPFTSDFKGYNTVQNISNVSIQANNDNIRNVIQVFGMADRDIDASESGLYPAYKKGDIIRVALENGELIQKMGYRSVGVFRKPELCTPEQCLLVAQRMLNIVSQNEKQCTIGILGDKDIFSGMIVFIRDNYLIGEDKYMLVRTVSESYNNGEYSANISGPLFNEPPEEYQWNRQ